MLYSSLVISLLASATTVVARQANPTQSKNVVPGAYIIEFNSGQVSFTFGPFPAF